MCVTNYISVIDEAQFHYQGFTLSVNPHDS